VIYAEIEDSIKVDDSIKTNLAFSLATTYSIEYRENRVFGKEKFIVVNKAKFKRLSGTHLIFSNSTSLIGENIIDVNCTNLLSIADEENGNVYTDCTSFLAEVEVRSIIKNIEHNYKTNTLMDSGYLFNEFTHSYYSGVLLQLTGTIIYLFARANDFPAGITVGYCTGISGAVISFFAFTKIGKAGDKLIQAGREQKLEEGKNNQSIDESQKETSPPK